MLNAGPSQACVAASVILKCINLPVKMKHIYSQNNLNWRQPDVIFTWMAPKDFNSGDVKARHYWRPGDFAAGRQERTMYYRKQERNRAQPKKVRMFLWYALAAGCD